MSFKIKNFAMPLVFLGAMLFSIFFGSFLSIEIKSFVYSCGLFIQKCLIFFLPTVVFSLIFSAIHKSNDGVLKYIFFLIPLVCISNFANTIISYFSAKLCLKDVCICVGEDVSAKLLPCFDFDFHNIIQNDMALVFGIAFGILGKYFGKQFVRKINIALDIYIKKFFKILIIVLPCYVLGMTLKLQHDNVFAAFNVYLPILVVFVISAYLWVILQYYILSWFKIDKTVECIKNIAPAVLVAFGSSSSAVALPFSILAGEKNTKQKNIARIVAPSTLSIHLVGDCFFIPLMALTAMVSFGMALPSMSEYLIFSLHFVLAKFAVAAVPGSGVFVMLPVMQVYLGLSDEMLAFVTAVYIVCDPIITACNVAGNGSFAIAFDKITQNIFKKNREL